ncbi:hypothetical protein JCM10450v2_004996 [Rhodotorula kratochvilovae]
MDPPPSSSAPPPPRASFASLPLELLKQVVAEVREQYKEHADIGVDHASHSTSAYGPREDEEEDERPLRRTETMEGVDVRWSYWYGPYGSMLSHNESELCVAIERFPLVHLEVEAHHYEPDDDNEVDSVWFDFTMPAVTSFTFISTIPPSSNFLNFVENALRVQLVKKPVPDRCDPVLEVAEHLTDDAPESHRRFGIKYMHGSQTDSHPPLYVFAETGEHRWGAIGELLDRELCRAGSSAARSSTTPRTRARQRSGRRAARGAEWLHEWGWKVEALPSIEESVSKEIEHMKASGAI